MIDPFIQLAFNIHSSPGVFALLLGSGVSRSAEIPTGWEVMLDLIRKVATLEGAVCEPDPEKWYAERYGEQPDYSSLLDRLASTPTLRQQMLRGYFEPTEEEREEGKKVPTPAHRAIASLVGSGALRIIITTNFDRLVETALEAQGIIPTVISSPDDADGATPIVHSTCTVIKVHGDYLDTRVKNSAAELETYDDRINRLLDRILDEFGLIVCGWSAQYDTALRTAIRRAPSRRYPMFWTKHGKLSKEASDIIKFRKASTIEIDGSDDFFGGLDEKHDAIRRFGETHPLSKAAALQTLKRYMSEDRLIIDLYDFVKDETRRTKQLLTTPDMLAAPTTIGIQMLTQRIKSYEERSSILRSLFAAGTYWSKPHNSELWGNCFASIVYSEHNGGGGTEWLKLRLYPALLLKYAIGISSILSNDYSVFFDICNRKMLGKYVGGEEVGLALHGFEIIHPTRANDMQNLINDTQSKYQTPLSDYLFETLRADFQDIVLLDEEYKHAFDKSEYIAGLVHLDLRMKYNPDTRVWLPFGSYRWRSWGRDGFHVAEEVGQEFARNRANWPPLRAGLFGGDLARAESVVKTANDWLASSDFASWTF